MNATHRLAGLLGAALLTAVLGCGRENTETSAADRETTQRIRQSLVADQSLSAGAKNVAIETDDDTVTLRGAVATEQERAAVAAKAKQAAPSKTIENELVVASR